MQLKSPSQAINCGLYINSQGFLKNPAEYFAKAFYDYHEFFYEQVAHKNKSQINRIVRSLRKPDQLALSKYLTFILPLKNNPEETELTFAEDDDWTS